MDLTLFEYILLAAGTILSITDPIAVVPAFLAMTPKDTTEQRLRTARTASLVCAGVLLSFSLLGQLIFKVMGVSLPSFQVAGGLVLLLVALDSLRAQPSPTRETKEETEEGTNKDDVSITPLAIPMLSGPGAITTVIVLESKANGLAQHLGLYGSILLVSLISYVVLRVATKQAKRITPTIMKITTRIMGLFLASIGIEFIVTGLRDIWTR
jgi:multiple antibiotic resistance protein